MQTPRPNHSNHRDSSPFILTSIHAGTIGAMTSIVHCAEVTQLFEVNTFHTGFTKPTGNFSEHSNFPFHRQIVSIEKAYPILMSLFISLVCTMYQN